MSNALFDLDPVGTSTQDQRIQDNTKDVAPEPGIFQGFGPAVGLHTMRAAANTARTLGVIAAAPAVAIEKLTGTEGPGSTSDSIFNFVDEHLNNAVDYWTPNAATTGKAGQIVGGIVEGIAPLALGPAGVPAMLGNAQVGTSMDLVREGVDADTSLKVGLAASASNAVGFKLPFLGNSLLSRMATGAAGNLAVNTVSTAVQGETLKSSGYDEQAKGYDWSDPTARALDIGMGMAFGLHAHATSPRLTPSQGDAVLTARNAKKFQADSAPGAPANAASEAAHTSNMEIAMRQLMAGEKVDLASTIQEADFIGPKQPKAAAAPVETKVETAVREAIETIRPADTPVLPLTGTRGVRNNNPGNIRKSATKWSGKIEGTDPAFETFKTPEDGIRALGKNLLNYQDKHGINTIEGIINRWAPTSENNTSAYVQAVAKETGLDPSAPLNLRNPDTLQKVTTAIIHHENGGHPYGADVVQSGVKAALGSVPVENAGAVVRNQLAHRNEIPQANREAIAKEYEAAAAQKPFFDKQINDIVSENGIRQKPMLPDELKGVDRATAKIMGDYNGDATKIKDLTRATIVVDTPEQAHQVLTSALDKFGNLTEMRNALHPDSQPVSPSGYRDMKMNMRVGDHTAELQVNFPEMMAAKEQAHGYYEQQEAVRRNAKNEGRHMNAVEAKEFQRLEDKQRAIYDAAWSSFLTKARKADSVTKVPLWEKESGSNTRGSGSQAKQTQSGVQDTGTPSTLANRVPLGNEDGSAITNILPPGIAGRKAAVVTERGQHLGVQYHVGEVGNLVTSHDNSLGVNPKFPAELQPRDRARAASEAQIAKIEQSIRPELLAESPQASNGAPIIGRDGVVESGNARTIALRRAYEGGNATHYKEWLIQNADRFGLDAAEIAQMKRPMLTRVGTDAYDRAEFARQANESSVAHMSSTEVAKSDASRMPDLEGLHSADDGTINMAQSIGFIRDFISKIAPNEQGAMMTAGGELSQDGLKRIRNAVFAKAYGDPEIVAMMGESTDANVKNILNGMMRAAPEVARLRELIEAGARNPIDIAPDLVKAVRQFSQIKSEGKTVDNFLAQLPMFDSGISPEVNNLLIGLQENSRAPKRIAEMIKGMTDTVESMGDPRQSDIFGGEAPAMHDVVANTVEGMRSEPKSSLPSSPEIDSMVQMAKEMPDAPVLTGFDADGNPTYSSMSDAMASIEQEHAQLEKESKSYEAATNCFLRNGA